ncbi:MAG: hypothetical protein EB072_17030, partial [Betaproteobacteria bacterium]|nr:hypothetical protein [Betaproteobacteria bacterium]
PADDAVVRDAAEGASLRRLHRESVATGFRSRDGSRSKSIRWLTDARQTQNRCNQLVCLASDCAAATNRFGERLLIAKVLTHG